MNNYEPKFIFKNGDVSTVYPTLFRKVKLDYERERLELPDGDFIDVDRVTNGNRKLAVLCHGLEGSSESKYIKSAGSLLSKNSYDIAAVNYRSCSGEINRLPRFYHAGETNDLKYIIDTIGKDYDEIYLAGYSLGANLILKYLGVESKDNKKIKAGVAVSCPMDLYDSSFVLNKRRNYIYRMKFMISFKKKLKEKSKIMPGKIDISSLDEVKDFNDIDNRYTSKLHGYKDAKEYYEKESAINYIEDIDVPALIINAQDDPILSPKCYPENLNKLNKNVIALYPKHGGHVGFIDLKEKYYWMDYKILDFFENKNKDLSK